MTVDRAGIRAFIEIPEDSWHLFPLYFMALTMELNHRFAAFTIEPKSVNKSIMKLAGLFPLIGSTHISSRRKMPRICLTHLSWQSLTWKRTN
jgi:hypothetical protein